MEQWCACDRCYLPPIPKEQEIVAAAQADSPITEANLVRVWLACGITHSLEEKVQQLGRDHANLINQDPAETLDLEPELIDIRVRLALSFLCHQRQIGAAMQRRALDRCCHGILEGDAHEVHFVLPSHYFYEETHDPFENLALAGPWLSMYKLDQWFASLALRVCFFGKDLVDDMAKNL